MTEDQADLLFQALASQPRRALLDLVRAHPGANLSFLAAHFSYSRIGVMKHLDILEAANLLISVREGRERLFYFNVVPIQEIHEHWSDAFSAHFAHQLLDLKKRIEGEQT